VTLLPDVTWRVTSVRHACPALNVNDRVPSGEIVSLPRNGILVLECGEGKIELAGGSSLEIRPRGRVLLLDGSVRVDSRGEVTILNRWSERVVVRSGSATVVSDLRALAPSAIDREPEPPKESGDRMRVRVERGQAVLRGAAGEMTLEAGEKARIDGRGRPTSEE
jgi:hypothetical protein